MMNFDYTFPNQSRYDLKQSRPKSNYHDATVLPPPSNVFVTQTLSTPCLHRSKEKRTRTAFTEFQLSELEREFKRNMYMFRQHRIIVAERLSLRESQIKIWFQNRRMRMKRETKPPVEKITKEKASTQCELKAQQAIVERLISNSEDPLKVPYNYIRISKATESVIQPACRLLFVPSIAPYNPDFAKILSYLQSPISENLSPMMSTSSHSIDLDMVLQSITTDLESSA